VKKSKRAKLGGQTGVLLNNGFVIRHYSGKEWEGTMNLETIGKWAFIVGLVLAVIAGLLFQAAWVVWVLVLLGVVVGLLNVGGTETQGFLVAAIAFTLASTALGSIPFVGGVLTAVLGYIGAFVSGAMVVVALKALFQSART
jgi:ATP synthase protein I